MADDNPLGLSGIVPSNTTELDDGASVASEDVEGLSNGIRDGDHTQLHARRADYDSTDQPPVVVPTEYSSFKLSTGQTKRSISDQFDFLPGELPMPKKVRYRAVKSLRKIVTTPTTTDTKESEVASDSPTSLSPEMQKANSEGLKMIQNIALPSLPALLQDIWVYLELLITIIAFILGLLGQFPIRVNLAFQYSYFILTLISMILALLDGFMYFIELGSCARAFRYYKSQLSKVNDYSDEDEEDIQIQRKSCCSPTVKEKFKMFFELGRTIVSELLLYPVLIFDLFSFIVCQSYLPGSNLDRVDFGLFVIGSFYLILAVYIMRIFVVTGSILSLLRLPIKKGSTDAPDTSLLLKFSIHILGQIFVHLMVIMVVGAKINNENSNNGNMLNGSVNSNGSNMTEDEDDPIIRASPFLWVSIVLGWILPLAGTAAFFIVNYYWMREFSIGFWVNMISLLQGASFAETVFGGGGFDETKEATLEFVEQTDYVKVKDQLTRFKSPPWWTKFFYPVRIPVVAICGLAYDMCLIIFIVSLVFTYDEDTVKVVIFKDDDIMTSLFIVSVFLILLTNCHILFLLNTLLLSLLFILSMIIAASLILLPLVIFVYFPLIGVIGYILLFRECCTCSKKDGSNIMIEMEDYDSKDQHI